MSAAARIAAILALAAGLTGCAALDAWHKCGDGCPGDAEISAAVRARLATHVELLAPNKVYVSTLDGTVYLSGEVVTDVQRATAVDIARHTPGVPRVVDMIGLEYDGP